MKSIDRSEFMKDICTTVFGNSFLANKQTPAAKNHRIISGKALSLSNAEKLITYFKLGFVEATQNVKLNEPLSISNYLANVSLKVIFKVLFG